MAIFYRYQYNTLTVNNFSNINLSPLLVSSFQTQQVAVGFASAITAYEKDNLDQFMLDRGYSFLDSATDISPLTRTETPGLLAFENIPAGAVLAIINDGGISKLALADADATDTARRVPIGIAGFAATAGNVVSGVTGGLISVPDVQWDVVPTVADVGKPVWLATLPGQMTLTEPSDPSQIGVVLRGGAGAVVIKPFFTLSASRITGVQGGNTLPTPAFIVATQSAIAAPTTYSGAMYRHIKYDTFNRIIFRSTAQAGAPTLSMLIFQELNGGSGPCRRIATLTAFPIPSAPTNFVATPTEGDCFLVPGKFFILWGRDSALGSFSLRTYGNNTFDLLNANMVAATIPTTFTTAIAANTTPATFDPVTDTVATTTDVSPVVRFLSV